MPSIELGWCASRASKAAGKLIARALARVVLDVGKEIVDEDLAREPLAEKADVGADDGTEIEQERRGLVRQAPP